MSERVTYLGHATVLLELNGVRLLTDPVLRRRVGPLLRRPPRPPRELLHDLDAVLVSHLHLDHFDPPSLRLLDHRVQVVGPAGSAAPLRRLGFTRVDELRPGERIEVGAARVTAVPARHAGHRHPLAAAADSVGYVVEGAHSVYYAGDTALFSGMKGLWSGLDVALLPIGGLGHRLPVGEHLTPQHAVQAMRLLGSRLTIPVHWGTYRVPGMPLVRPDIHRLAPVRFLREAQALAPAQRALLLQPGEAADLASALA